MTQDDLRALHAQARALLARMATLSDARGASFIPSGNSGKKESTGTTGPGSRDGDADLFTKWAQRFADPANADRLPTLILLAGRELAIRTRRSPVMISPTDPAHREDEWERDARIIDWYEGIPANEAAIMESACGTYCPTGNIRKVRRRNDRDPDLGNPRPPREQWSRLACTIKAEDPSKSIRDIAREMNLAPSTVARALRASDDDGRIAA